MKMDKRIQALVQVQKKTDTLGQGDAVIYTRVSSKEQAENNASLNTQKRHCEDLARKRELRVVEYFGGTFESAKSDERKEFKRMLAFVKRHKNVSYILVYAYDRFSRTGTNGAYISEQLKKQGIAVLSYTQEVDPHTASGSFQQNLYYMFSQFDNQQRTSRMVEGFREKLLLGYWPLPLCVGFTNLNKGKPADQHEIVVNEHGRHCKKAWHWIRDHDMESKEVVERLVALGVPMTEQRLSKMLHNFFCCGLIVSKYIPGKVVEGKHEKMVPQKVFMDVLEILSQRSGKGRHAHETAVELPLRKFVQCSECGAPYTGYLQKQKRLYYYRCRTKGCCKNRSQKIMHRAFAEFLSEYELDEKSIPLVKKSMRHLFQQQNAELMAEAESIKANLAKVNEKVEQLEERFATGEVSGEIFEKFHARFSKEKSELSQKMEFAGSASSNLDDCIEWVVDQCGNLAERWASSSSVQQAVLQNMLFPAGISYDRENGRFLTSRVNTFLAPIPDMKRIRRQNKRGLIENSSINPPLRRERDSNPRYVSVNTLSKRARSATLPPLLIRPAKVCNFCFVVLL